MFARLLVLLAALNAWDAAATLHWIRRGVATEANPLLEAALNLNPCAFVVVKAALIFAGVAVLWRHRDHKLARAGAVVCTVVYALIGVYHTTPWLLNAA